MVEEEKKDVEKIKSNISFLKKDIVAAKEQLAEIDKEIEIFEKEIALRQKIHGTIMNNFKIVKPVWSYETNSVYLDDLKKLNGVIHEKALLSWDIQRKKFEDNKSLIESQIKKHEEQIVELEKELN